VITGAKHWCVAAFSLIFILPARAQMSEEEARVQMVESVEEKRHTEEMAAHALRSRRDKRGWLLDYGYTAAVSYTASDDNDRNPAAQDDPDHVWDNEYNLFGVVASVDRKAKFYARVKTLYTDNAKISPTTRESDVEQMKIDMMYFERSFPGRRIKHTLTVGRQFYKFGRGIAYGLIADGVLWRSKGRKLLVDAVFMRQKPGDNNIDNLAPGSGRTKRLFFGTECSFKFAGWLKLDLFHLWNADRNTVSPYSTGAAGQTQRSEFHSRYYGVGFEGTFFTKLNYWSEYILVRGKTYNAATAAQPVAAQVGVDADALDVGLRYLFGGDLVPALFAEYAFGSGDADRVSNVTSSRDGSSFGKDSVFRSFGGLTMGNALAPSLANIRILKAGTSFKPLGRWGASRWNDMTLNLTGYTYRSDAGGPTSDAAIFPTGDSKSSDDIGDEYDVSLSWKMFNDMNYQFKFGSFLPGPAYGSLRGHETYMKLKVSLDL